ncbi:MAG: alpha/beta hydrolase [Pseudomonadota bacterium]
MRLPLLCTALLALTLTPPAAVLHAQTQPPLLALSEVVTLTQSDPAAALAKLDQVISQMPQDDARLTFDLFEMKAQILRDLGRTLEAAQTRAQLAVFAAGNRERLDIDPVPIWAAAAALFEEGGDLATARDALGEMKQQQRENGASADQLDATQAQIDRLTLALGEDVKEPLFAADNSTRGAFGTGGTAEYTEVDVYYATDRARSGETDPGAFYGYARGALDYGIATVTIPKIHQQGIVDAPSIWKLEFSENPAKHVVLQSITPVAVDAFFGAMSRELETRGADAAFVFIHGYNVAFDQAARRAAQIAYDMKFPGIPVLYSWPSRGSTAGYIADTAVVRLSGRRLSRFLDDMIDRSGAGTIHIVAHSMGNRALTDALELLALRRGLGSGSEPVFDQVLFAAPDVDADLFAEMMPTIRPVAKRLTLYASEQDWALATSKQLHGDAPRAGQGGGDMITRPEFDSVDMSLLGDDMLAHSYFADDSSALADMVALFWRNAAPNLRCGLEPVVEDGTTAPIWNYTPGSCSERALMAVLAHMQSEGVSDSAAARQILASTIADAATAEALQPVVDRLLSE